MELNDVSQVNDTVIAESTNSFARSKCSYVLPSGRTLTVVLDNYEDIMRSSAREGFTSTENALEIA